MGTKNISEIATTTGRIVKHVNPTEDDDKIRLNNYELVPKLPSVKITHKTKQSPGLSDFLDKSDTVETKRTALQLQPVGREKAFAILKQYNKLVSNETKLSVKNLPSVKLPTKKATHRILPKPEVTPRKPPIFTEGISSLSKSSKPSFLIPKDKVLRANLPNNIVVAHKKDNFSFGVKIPKRKSPREVDDTGKFKQMHNLGLDSLPIVNLEKYMKTKQKPTGGVKGLKPIPNTNKKSKPRKSDTIVPDLKFKSLESMGSYDMIHERRNAYRWKHENSARSEGKAKVVWVGNTLRSEFAENRTRISKGVYPQYDSRMKQDENLSRLKFQNRDPSIYGVCSLAPIDVIGQTSKLLVTDQRNEFEPKGYRGGYRRYPNIHPTRSSVQDYYFESDSESSLNTNWKNMINNAMTGRSSSVDSGSMTPHGVPNPPPSYVSSNNDEEPSMAPLEISKTMHRIQEERSSAMMEFATNRVQQTFSAGSKKLHSSPLPAIVIEDDGALQEQETETPKQEKSPPRKGKETIQSSIIELKINNKHLSVPKFMETERRPPGKTDTFESSSQAQSYSSFELTKAKNANSGPENQKLNVTTLQLNTANEHNSPIPPFNSFHSDAEMVGMVPRNNNNSNHEKVENGNDDQFMHLTVNNKTLQFISPLETQSNAKRQ